MYHSENNGKVNSKKQFVLRIFQAGYNIIPVSGKFPPAIPWKRYQLEAVTPEEIVEWSKGRFATKDGRTYAPELLNFGLLTGAKPYSDAPALVVIDSDDAEAESIVQARCPETPVRQQTGKGGWHRVYRRPANVEYIPNRQKTHIGGKEYNLDIRADGGYILCPGSIHPTTKKIYQEVSPWTAELIASAPIYDPTWIPDERGETFKKPKKTKFECAETENVSDIQQLAREYLIKRRGSQVGNNASAYCFALANELIHGFGLSPEDALPVLLEWGEKESNVNEKGDYAPWSEGELAHKLADAADSYSPKGSGYLLGVDASKVDEIVKWPEITDNVSNKPPINGDNKPADNKPPIKVGRRGYKLAELLARPPTTWLIDQHITTASFAVIYGVSGAAKSFYALDMALSVSAGKQFLNRFPVKKGPVAYICSEGGNGIGKRAKAWLKHHDLNDEGNICFIPAPFNLQEPDEAKQLLKIACATLNEAPSLVIVDTLSRNMASSDRDEKAIMAYVRNIDHIIAIINGTVISVHHSGWLVERERGVTQLRDSADAMLQLLPDDINNTAANSRTTAICTKQKDDEPFQSYTLNKNLVSDSCVWTYGGTVMQAKLEAKNVKDNEKELQLITQEQEFLSHVPIGQEHAISTTDHFKLCPFGRSTHNNIFQRLKGHPGSLRWEAGMGSKPATIWRIVK